MKDIPMVDLAVQHKKLKKDIFKKWEKLCDSTSFVLGKEVLDFEEEFAEYCGAKYAIGVSSGTAALHIALEALNCENKKVVTSPLTFIASAEAVVHGRGDLVFKDIEKDYYTLNPDKLSDFDFNSQDIILPVHLYGQSADMDGIMKIASEKNLKVVEDCAQSHGAVYKDDKLGTIGDAGCFSFYPAKNLGAYGEAGCVVCSDEGLASLIRRLRTHGAKNKYYHTEIGYNYRIDALQAAVLRIKLRYLQEWNQARREHAALYDRLLEGIPVKRPRLRENSVHVFHQYSIIAPNREKLAQSLRKNKIATAVHYPLPLHLQPVFSYLNLEKGSFPVAEDVADGCISLPMYPELKKTQIEYVCSKVREFYE